MAALQNAGNHFKSAPHLFATFLSNHDSFAGRGRGISLAAILRNLNFALTLLFPGVPLCVLRRGNWYGAGFPTGDTACVPMSWTGDTARAGFTTGSPFRALAANVQTQNLACAAGRRTVCFWSHYRALLIHPRRARIAFAR